MALNEIHRQEYLEIMGVQTYFPRFILPGAKESVQSSHLSGFSTPPRVELNTIGLGEESVVNSGLEASAGEATGLGENPGLKKVDLAGLESELGSKRTPVSVPAPESIPAQELPEPQGSADAIETRFQFAFIRVNDKLCILNQIPYVGIKQQLSIGHKNLLINMLKALKIDTSALNFDAMTFRWPLVEGEHVDKSAGAARSALSAYLEHQMTEQNSKMLLVMGALAASYTIPESQQGLDDSSALYQVENQHWQIAKIRSLDEILSMPQMKREVWRQLQKLNLGGEYSKAVLAAH